MLCVQPNKNFVMHFEYKVNDSRICRLSASNIYRELQVSNQEVTSCYHILAYQSSFFLVQKWVKYPSSPSRRNHPEQMDSGLD